MRAASILLLLAIAAAPEMRYFRYERPVLNTPQEMAAKTTAQTCTALDAAAFAHAAAGMGDLRLYRDGVETPYVIRMAVQAPAAQQALTPLNLGLRGGKAVFDAAMPEGKFSDVELTIGAENFIATVSVSGSSAESGGRETKLGAFTIFDLTKQRLGRSTVLHLPESDFRYLHFEVAGPLTPEDFTGISTMRSAASQPRYTTIAASSSVTVKGHDSVIEFTVPAHVPVERVEFAVGASPANFSREVRVAVEEIDERPASDVSPAPQRSMSSGNLLRIHSVQNGHRIDAENLAVDAPAMQFATPSKWTVSIDNGSDTPVAIESVRLEIVERNLCFDATAQSHYALYYGDPALEAPRYDYATLFAPEADSVRASLGPEQANGEFQARPDARPFTERHPALLWVALLAVIGLLGLIAVRTGKRGSA